jgi:hypothetical protein
MRYRLSLTIAALLAPASAFAQTAPAAEPAEEEEPICADRPGIASFTCTVPQGKAHVEMAVDWSFQEDGDDRTDTFLAGATLVRIGVDDRTEVQAGWTAYGRVRERAAGVRIRDDSVGDAFLGVKHRFFEREGFSVAAQGRFGLPIGGSAIGAGDWGFDLIVPVEAAAGGATLLFTPSLSAAPDGDRRGRHLAYGGTAGIGFSLSGRLSAQLHLAFTRDDDPLGATTEAVAGLGLAYTITNDFQLDAGAIIGLNEDSADLELYVGAAGRF